MLIGCSNFRQKLLTVVFNNSSSRRRARIFRTCEILMLQFMLVMSQQFSQTRTKVPSFYEQIWQLENNRELQIIAEFIVII